MISNIDELYEWLEQALGKYTWWDTENPWEIIIGSILVQNTNWRNVDYSLENLRKNVGISPNELLLLELTELEELIRPSGFYKGKARTIQQLLLWLQEADFDLAGLAEQKTQDLRTELLTIKGIGEETADVLLVYVFNKSVFIADRYAQRMFNRLGVAEKLNYKKLQQLIDWPIDYSSQAAQNLHGWIVDYGQLYLKTDEAWQSGMLSDFQLRFDA